MYGMAGWNHTPGIAGSGPSKAKAAGGKVKVERNRVQGKSLLGTSKQMKAAPGKKRSRWSQD